MRIEAYRFGRIVIGGVTYTADVIVLPGRVISPWWREAGGHVFDLRDLGPLMESGAEVVVLGTGALGMVRVPPETVAALEATGAEVIVERTARAVERFNLAAGAGRVVAAGLHLTC